MNEQDIRDLVKQAQESPDLGQRPREEELTTKPPYLRAREALKKWAQEEGLDAMLL